MQNDEITKFYNDFLHSRMINYRINDGNKRIKLATRFALNNIKEDDFVFEIGCGIGIVTEKIAKKVNKGFIWACDISNENIWYAKQTINKKNINFFNADIFDNFNQIKKRINKPIDVFLLVDVIEHLPKEKHFELLKNLKSIAATEFKIILTFPSEYYQRYLKENNPSELQLIDEVIDLDYLIRLTKAHGMLIKYFELKDVYKNDQYIHCIISNKIPIKSEIAHKENHILIRIYNRIKRYYNKRKYIDNIFNR